MDPKLVLKIVIFLSFLNSYSVDSLNYYFDSNYSGETKSGLSKKSPFNNLKKIRTIILNPGDSIFLANGSHFQGNIMLQKQVCFKYCFGCRVFPPCKPPSISS